MNEEEKEEISKKVYKEIIKSNSKYSQYFKEKGFYFVKEMVIENIKQSGNTNIKDLVQELKDWYSNEEFFD